MAYIVEVLEDDKVWLLNENRRLLSMHRSLKEAREACLRQHNEEPEIIDRRQQLNAGRKV